MIDPLVLIAAVLTAVLGVGRITRLVTYDDYPPTTWLRIRWQNLAGKSGWGKLATCGWCASPWIMAFCMAWAFAGYFWGGAWLWSWWIFWSWMALSYVVAMIYVRDEPRD